MGCGASTPAGGVEDGEKPLKKPLASPRPAKGEGRVVFHGGDQQSFNRQEASLDADLLAKARPAQRRRRAARWLCFST